MDPAEYKHVALGLLFLKYISDAFQEQYDSIAAIPHADPEDRDEYTAENIFWVPKEARWSFLRDNARQSTIGKFIDDAMGAIEKENPSLKGILPKTYGRPDLDKTRLGELIDLISSIDLGGGLPSGPATCWVERMNTFWAVLPARKARGGGEFYTPSGIVRLLVEMLEPYRGKVYDPLLRVRWGCSCRARNSFSPTVDGEPTCRFTGKRAIPRLGV